MKSLLSILLSTICLIKCFAQDTIINYKENQPIYWGSLSVDKLRPGFYGQEFELFKDIELNSFSVFIYDHPEHDETKSTINYAIYTFDSIPEKEIFLSPPLNIAKDELNNFKAYQFKTPFTLKKGKYLFAVGQPNIQGFVAFGNGTAKDNYHSIFWAKAPMEGLSDGNHWFDMIGSTAASDTTLTDEQKKGMNKVVVMMRLVYK